MDERTNLLLEGSGNPMRWRLEARSIIGGREEQQDAGYAYVGDRAVFAVVCDGIGGHSGGSLASRTAAESMRSSFAQRGGAGDPATRAAFLHQAMLDADLAVSRALNYGPGGTTLVAVLIADGLLHWVSVGDSRLYIMRDKELKRATRDHNYGLKLDEMRAKGEITPEQYEREAPRRDALISFLGCGKIETFDLTRAGLPLQRGDGLLLTTDGLYKGLRPESLGEVMGARVMDIQARADTALSSLSAQTKRTSQDNTTFMMIDIL